MGLKISEFVAELNKVQAAVGDLPVVFKAVEGDAESFLHTIGIELAPSSSKVQSTVSINHTTEAPAEPEPEPAADATNAPTDQTATHVPDGTQG